MRTKLFFFAAAAAFILVGALPMLLSRSASAQSGASAIIINSQGILGGSGQYVQSSGTFFKVVQGTPTPTPTPEPCVPAPGSPPSTIYFGDYTLTNGESGNFLLSVQSTDNAATGSAAPQNIPTNPVIVEQGNVVVALQINIAAGTGSGTINFTSGGTGISGNIVITSKFPVPAGPPVTCSTPTPTPSFTPSPTPTPTNGTALLSGKVLTPDNRGVKGATVSLVDLVTNRRTTAITNQFGLYSFIGVPVGSAFTVGVSSKRYRFTSQFIFVSGNQTDINFVGVE
ncbi:hypothetical protein BH10ACI2_BH10ACI2_19720 [soil metagenome]